MGKGDKKSKRGKIILGSFGVRRRRKAKKSVVQSVKEGAVKSPGTALPEVTAETKAAKTAKTARPRTAVKPAVKPAEKKSEKETGTAKAAKPAAKAKKPAAGKEE